MEGLSKSAQLKVQYGVKGKFFALLSTTIKQKPDYIHFDWIHQYYLRRKAWMTLINYPLFIAQIFIIKYIFRVKIYWTLHNITPHDQPYLGPAKWSRRYFAKSCDLIRVFSKSTIDTACDVLGTKMEKFRIIPEGSYVNFYPNTISKENARSKLGLGPSSMIFLFFGGIRPYKGIEILINTFQKYSHNNWNLIIAGNSPNPSYISSLHRMAQGDSSIQFESNGIAVENVQDFMNAADVVVLPFKKIENSGSAVLAMGFKKAVIAPNIGVLPTRLKAQKELLYDYDIEEIFDRLEIEDTNYLIGKGIKNYKNVLQYNWTDFAICFV